MSRWIMVVVLAVLGVAGCTASAPRQQADPFPARGLDQALPPIEDEISFVHGEIRLVGTLLTPGTPGPYAVTVLLSGSGPQDRDGVSPGFVPGYSPSRFLAEHLVRQGIASFRYDERGVGASSGEHGTATSGDLAGDAAAAVAHLRTLSRIDPDRIGLIGHSEGGMLVAGVAARDSRVAFVVSLAGPAVPGYELLMRQNELISPAHDRRRTISPQHEPGRAARALERVRG